MTNEQHIENLKKLKSFHNGAYGDSIRAAIEALEQQTENAVNRKEVVSRISDLLMIELRGERLPTWNEVYRAIGELPPVQPKQKTGEWIPTGYDGYADGSPVYEYWECSECGWEHNGDDETLTEFCPNCGAKMVIKE